jgi:hypothetical protein
MGAWANWRLESDSPTLPAVPKLVSSARGGCRDGDEKQRTAPDRYRDDTVLAPCGAPQTRADYEPNSPLNRNGR